ncbi:hypothetical protein MMC12_006156 [Toensbergia leucococca]|nr:hypothetical protein [Toensbergia leucococca]
MANDIDEAQVYNDTSEDDGKSDLVLDSLLSLTASDDPDNREAVSLSRETQTGKAKSTNTKSGERLARSPRSKRSRRLYTVGYRRLLDEAVQAVTTNPIANSDDPLPFSQVGATMWSPEEKNVLFQALSRKGKDDIRGLAAALGSKSEMEVRIYLQLLEEAVLGQHLHLPRHQLFSITDVPAAFEISQECSTVLDQAADALLRSQPKRDKDFERSKHDDLWLLDLNLADRVNQSLRKGGVASTQIIKAIPAAELLHLSNFLELSTRVFMNSCLEEDNWRSYVKPPESPSILYTAFSDLHTLAVSITKRLVQSSLFYAMSRLKATTSSQYKFLPVVRRLDVMAALRVMGMTSNAKSSWVRVARRCKLDVYENMRGKKVIGERLTYDEAERILCQQIGGEDSDSEHDNEISPTSPPGCTNTTTEPGNEPNDSFSAHSPSSSDISSPSSSENDSRQTQNRENKKRARNPEDLEQDETVYTEALDQRASQHEEQLLWDMLHKDPPESIKPEDLELPKRPLNHRKTGEDLRDWRFWMNYGAEWEKHDSPVPRSSFRKKRRKITDSQAFTGSTEIELSLQSPIRANNSQGNEHGSELTSKDDDSVESGDGDDNEEVDGMLELSHERVIGLDSDVEGRGKSAWEGSEQADEEWDVGGEGDEKNEEGEVGEVGDVEEDIEKDDGGQDSDLELSDTSIRNDSLASD